MVIIIIDCGISLIRVIMKTMIINMMITMSMILMKYYISVTDRSLSVQTGALGWWRGGKVNEDYDDDGDSDDDGLVDLVDLVDDNDHQNQGLEKGKAPDAIIDRSSRLNLGRNKYQHHHHHHHHQNHHHHHHHHMLWAMPPINNRSAISQVKSNRFCGSGTSTVWQMMMTLKILMRRFLLTGKLWFSRVPWNVFCICMNIYIVFNKEIQKASNLSWAIN